MLNDFIETKSEIPNKIPNKASNRISNEISNENFNKIPNEAQEENENKIKTVTGLQFKDMNLNPLIQQALAAMKFIQPTPIQKEAIPLVLERKDLIACAQTGTGKTAAFCLPMVMRLLENPEKTALILAPTRELVMQTADFLKKLTIRTPNIRLATLIGGSDMRRQYRDLARKPQIVIATPGRLMDHLRRKSVSLSQLDMLVLDEGDRMLDMGFEPQLSEIVKYVPEQRQTLLFSATMAQYVQKLASKYLKNPKRVSVGPESQPVDKIKQAVIQTTRENKNNVLLEELNTRQGSILIFTKTKHGTDRLAEYLLDYGYDVTRIHGGRSQSQRNFAIQGFRLGKYKILVATDVAARGLDIPHIAHVINYDLPQDVDDYLHRVGRTARAGATGEAVCLLTPDERRLWIQIARKYNLTKIPGFTMERPLSSKAERGFRSGGGGGRGRDRDRDRDRGGDRDRSDRGDRGGGERKRVFEKPFEKSYEKPYERSFGKSFGMSGDRFFDKAGDKPFEKKFQKRKFENNDFGGEVKRDYKKDFKKDFNSDFNKDFDRSFSMKKEDGPFSRFRKENSSSNNKFRNKETRF